MRCVICDDWTTDAVDCDICDALVCDSCFVEGDSGEVFCSEDCQSEIYVNQFLESGKIVLHELN